MAFSGHTQRRDYYLEPHIVGGSEDTSGGHWVCASAYPEASAWPKQDFDVEAHTHNQLKRWNTISTIPSNSSFDPRSPPPIRSSLTPSLPSEHPSVNTNLSQYRQPEASPTAPSPSPSSAYFYASPYNGSSTPSLSPSLSSPPTGKSAHLTLTPDQRMNIAYPFPGSPHQWDVVSPGISYGTDSGITPNMANLDIQNYEESTFQMVDSVKMQSQSSMLLGSMFATENSQSTDLDPLELDVNDLQAPASGLVTYPEDDGTYNINIVSADNSVQNVPIRVNLQEYETPWELLSPLSALRGLPVDHISGGGNLGEQLNPSHVSIQPADWAVLSQPAISPTLSPLNDNRPSPHGSTASNSAGIPESPFHGTNQQHRRFHHDATPSMHTPSEVIHSGQYPGQIVNPKGVSERTLAAAKSNRKREAKFQCPICGNSQTSKQNLENHIASRHLQLKRFVCPVPNCSAKYGHARGVNRHLDTKHPGHREPNSKGKRGAPKRS